MFNIKSLFWKTASRVIVRVGMIVASFDKPLLIEKEYQDLSDKAELHMVLSKKDVVSGVVSLKTFYRHSHMYVNCILHTDSNVSKEDEKFILRHIPFARFVTDEEEKELRNHKWKAVREFQKKWQGKKLINTSLISCTPKRVLIDSDILFIRKPVEIISWIKDSSSSFSMIDCSHFSNLSSGEFAYYFNVKISKKPVNTGIVGLQNQEISLKKIENFLIKTREIIAERTLSPDAEFIDSINNHLLEQTAFTYLFSQIANFQQLPSKKYAIYKSLKEMRASSIKKDQVTAIHFSGDPLRRDFFFYYFVLCHPNLGKFGLFASRLLGKSLPRL